MKLLECYIPYHRNLCQDLSLGLFSGTKPILGTDVIFNLTFYLLRRLPVSGFIQIGVIFTVKGWTQHPYITLEVPSTFQLYSHFTLVHKR